MLMTRMRNLTFAKKLLLLVIVQSFLFYNILAPVGASLGVANFVNSPTQMPGTPNYASDPSPNLKTATPHENIPQIQGLDSNSYGSAQFELPLTLPPGRQGMMPSLAISYSSNSGNGWLGVDFDIVIPKITTYTTFGVPDYDGQDRYLLNGSQLIAVSTSGDTTTYHERVEGAFQRIQRIGTDPSNYRFEVTDKLGVKNIYGTDSSALRSYRTINGTYPIYTWYLSQTIDPNGNTVTYEYATDTNTTGNGENWQMLYLNTIHYTGHVSGEIGNYSVHFIRDNGNRQDVISDARGRFQIKTRYRLQEVQIKYQNNLIRKYVLEYIYSDFGKSKLATIRELDGTGNEFYAYTFDYFRMPTQGDGFAGFQTTAKWDNATRSISETQTFSGGAELFAGVGPSGYGENSVGAGISFQVDFSNDLSTFLDMDGDGLSDQIFQDLAGTPLGYRLNTGNGFSSPQSLQTLPGLINSDLQLDIGFKVSAGLGPLQANIGGNFAFVTGLSTLNDVNGDGFIDFVPSPFSSSFQQGSGLGGFTSTPWTVPGGPLNLDLDMGISDMEHMDDLEESYHNLDAVRKWQPYHAGTVVLTSDIEKIDDGQGISDGVELNLYKNQTSLFSDPVILTEGEQTTHFHQEPISVTPNDAIYFKTSAVDSIENDMVLWNAEIAYTEILFHDDMERYFQTGQSYPYNGKTYTVYADGARYYIQIIHGSNSFRVYSDQSYTVTETPYVAGMQEAVVIDAATENTGLQTKTGMILLQDYDTNGNLITVPQYLHVFNAAQDFNLTDIRETAGLNQEHFGGGVYNWYYGEWNGSMDWEPALIGAQLEEGDPIPFVTMSALEETDSNNPLSKDIWKGTETAYKDRSADENGNLVEEEKFFAALVSYAEMAPSKKGGDATDKIPADEISVQAGGISIFPQSLNFAFNAGAGIAGLPSPTVSFAHSKTYADLLDMNGDQYPDQIISGLGSSTITGVMNVGGTGYGKTSTFSNGFSNIRESITQVYGLGFNPGGTGSDIKVRQKANGKVRSANPDNASFGPLPSLNGSLGENITKIDFVDINGDGLPDHVKRDSENEYRVKLNLGDDFGVEESYSTAGFGQDPLQSDIINLLTAVNSEISGFPQNGADSVRYSNTVNGGFNISFGIDKINANGGLSISGNRTKVDLVDMNGDGLVDQVFKLNRNDHFLVRMNYGDHFGPITKWYTPGWSIDGDDFQIDNFVLDTLMQVVEDIFEINGAGDIDTSAVSIDFGALDGILGDLAEDINILGAGDVINWTGVIGVSVGLGGTIEIPLIPTPISIYIAPSGNFGYNLSSSQLQMSDIDGDGLPDHIFKYWLDDFFRVKVNNAKKVGLLKTIQTPLGGSISLDYERTKNSVAHPHSQYVLSELVHDDSMGNSYTVQYDYFDSGYYDRSEREFYGFAQVRETYANQTYVDRFFHNQDFYQKGLLVSEESRDASDLLMLQTDHLYDLVLVAQTDKPVYFPALVQSTQRFYDLTDPQRLAPMIKSASYQYDQYGNVTQTRDQVDVQVAIDDIHTYTTYHEDLNHYIVGSPASVKITDNTGVTYRQQFYSYDSKGNLIETKYYLDTQVSDPVYLFSYDPYGNILEQTDPSGYQVSYVYDNTNHIYPVQTTDSFGYTTAAAYDFRFGVITLTTDANQHSTTVEYDAFGRTTKVWSPYDNIASGIPSVEYSYFIQQMPLKAVAKNKLHFDANNTETVDTVVVIDGIGRVIQSKTEAEVEVNGTDQHGMVISGQIEFDEMGRLKRQGQPIFMPGYNLDFTVIAMKNPTVLAYDALDRQIQVTLADNSVIDTHYSNEPDSEQNCFKTTVIDPLGNQKATYLDMSSNTRQIDQFNQNTPIVTTYRYNILDELIQIEDDQSNLTTISYDTLGRQIGIDNPDRGLQEFSYDLAGNLIGKVDANLKANSQAIQYAYEFNRLSKIDYPTSTDVEFAYGAVGASNNRVERIVSVTDASGTTELSYGKLGDITKVEKTLNFLVPGHSPEMFTNEYLYDYMGRVEWQRFPDNEEVFYQFDQGGMTESVYGLHKGARFDYVKQSSYDEFGQKVSVQYGNEVETRYSYNPTRRWLDTIKTNNVSGTSFQDVSYSRDLVGNILASHNLGEKVVDQSYAYDDLYRLVYAEGMYQAPKPKFTSYYEQNISYDSIGNITQKSSVGIENPGNRDIKELNYELSYQYDTQHPHQAAYIGDQFYEYDGNGNLVGVYLDRSLSDKGNGSGGNSGNSDNSSKGKGKKKGHSNPNNPHSDTDTDTGSGSATGTAKLDQEETYLWDEDNRLMQVKFEGRSVDFLYDATGRRTVKRGQQGEMLYVDDYFQLQNGNEVTKHIFVGGTRVVSKISHFQDTTDLNYEEKNVHFYHPDHLGSTSFVTLPDGDEWEHTQYTPYGETWVDDVTNPNKIRWFYTSKELDEATDFYYYGARYYHQKTGRWVNPDPALMEYTAFGGVFSPVNLSLYHYAANNPVGFIDPEGRAASKKGGPKKPISRRSKALGATPSKNSKTGKEVWKRWETQGKARTNPVTKQKEVNVRQVDKVKGGTRVWVPLDHNIHMGHKVGAVDYWEQGAIPPKTGGIVKAKHKTRYAKYTAPGHTLGFKGKTNRAFMRDSANYRFEWGPLNSSHGAQDRAAGHIYKTLPTGAKSW